MNIVIMFYAIERLNHVEYGGGNWTTLGKPQPRLNHKSLITFSQASSRFEPLNSTLALFLSVSLRIPLI